MLTECSGPAQGLAPRLDSAWIERQGAARVKSRQAEAALPRPVAGEHKAALNLVEAAIRTSNPNSPISLDRGYPVPVLLDDGVEGSWAGMSLLSAAVIVFGSYGFSR
jgi:hypothetical protein